MFGSCKPLDVLERTRDALLGNIEDANAEIATYQSDIVRLQDRIAEYTQSAREIEDAMATLKAVVPHNEKQADA